MKKKIWRYGDNIDFFVEFMLTLMLKMMNGKARYNGIKVS
jgi:hypothetical protein